ncbi:phosphoglycerate dehydrogenase-like oxidoreductase [secondary endosymbiont of Heteropsylla cubana]|uniref:Erythronate-4-phosphate dehydrogenase n=1 Tax=secondary endosymbiont of Heteropsylla cubana TaxID=134287 RepID=J3VUB2_9ENTR|nr:4-phosphoerythronate dehydrogenase [secondary endosymbiont of Heteropsylla cubana]AFP85716.1 phosphoglycerate dehydrogenase-like oxidoreductase [secondary endosymbiont of Heteropsylla cubana]
MKILVDDHMPYAEELFSRFGQVKTVSGRDIPMISLKTIDALMVRSTTRIDSDLLNDTSVKFVGTATAGSDHIDTSWLEKMGITFASAPGCNAAAVVEYVFSALLWIAKRDSFFLRDKIVGIVGVGNIGNLLKHRLNALGVQTLLCDPPLAESEVMGDWQSLERLVAEADILTFHTPLIRSGRHTTWHQVDDALLEALPAGRIIINTCRGEVVDNAALLRALEKGKSLKVILDVWESEPKISLPLLSLVDIGTPHIAGYSLEGKARGTMQVFNAYSSYLGSKERVILTELLPSLLSEYISFHRILDEEAIRFLSYLVYDIGRDDTNLRRVANLSGKFDSLRKNYYPRREWSSVVVETDNTVTSDMLKKLGFQSCIRFG